ncbi:hypothetical protein AB1K54_16590 [Microbacterium sp. BWT-B31]|uniref:hypothetical protein n=1 Tax=Microbacterium sp. BWT-B31 TaxID=3232072 RepID=UPI00352818D0
MGLDSMRSTLVAGVMVVAAVLSGCVASTETSPYPTSETDATQALLRCLRDHSWDAQLEQGGVSVGTAKEQADVLARDTEECNEDLDPAKFVTDEQRAAFYDLQVQTAACLTENGSPVTPPSRQAFLDDGAKWNPYVALRESGGMPTGGFDRLNSLCPQKSYWDVLGE